MSEDNAKLRKPHVLVVDDEAFVRDVCGQILTQAGYEVSAASSAQEAASVLRAGSTDLIFLDVRLPGADGFDLCKQIRAGRATSKTPVVMITGLAGKDDILRAVAAGANDYIVKPFRVETVLEKARKYLLEKGVPGQREEPADRTAALAQKAEEPPAPESVAPAAGGVTVVRSAMDLSATQTKVDVGRLKHFKDLATPPFVVIELLSLLRNPRASAEDLVRVLTTDQALTARILKLANSSIYGTGKRVTDIQRAIVQIGTRAVRNLALGMSVANALKSESRNEDFNIGRFWHHCIAVATFSKLLAEETRLAPPEESFVSGLFHDIGKALLNQYMPDEFGKSLKTARERRIPIRLAEREVMNLTHVDIGAEVLKNWEIPELYIAVINDSHTDLLTLAPRRPPHFTLVVLVQLSNVLAKAYGMGYAGDNVIDDLPMELLTELKLTESIYDRIEKRAKQEVVELLVIIPGASEAGSESKRQAEASLSDAGKLLFVQDVLLPVRPVEIALRQVGADLKAATLQSVATESKFDKAVINVSATKSLPGALPSAVKETRSRNVPTVVLVPRRLSPQCESVLSGMNVTIIEKPFDLQALISAFQA